MKILIVHDRTVSIPVDSLRTTYGLEALQNTYPKEDGIAIVSQEKTIDWAWPDYVLTVGNVEIGRHKRDAHIDPASEDIIASVQQIIDSILDSTQPAEDEEFV